MLKADICPLEVLESIADIHAYCIEHDNTMATFLPPLSRPRIVEHWQNLFEETSDQRLIFISVSKVTDRSTREVMPHPFNYLNWLQDSSNAKSASSPDLEVSGVVSLSMPLSETGPFRGLVQKLFISPHHRRRGLATQLMARLELEALKRNKWSLMLDTIVGTPAEQLYPRLGWNTLGVVKEYGFSPKDRDLVDEIFFWKDIRRPDD